VHERARRQQQRLPEQFRIGGEKRQTDRLFSTRRQWAHGTVCWKPRFEALGVKLATTIERQAILARKRRDGRSKKNIMRDRVQSQIVTAAVEVSEKGAPSAGYRRPRDKLKLGRRSRAPTS